MPQDGSASERHTDNFMVRHVAAGDLGKDQTRQISGQTGKIARSFIEMPGEQMTGLEKTELGLNARQGS
jgi:hypothetical protein